MNIFRHFTSNGQQGAVRSSVSPDSAHGGGSGSVDKTEMNKAKEDEEKQISADEDVELGLQIAWGGGGAEQTVVAVALSAQGSFHAGDNVSFGRGLVSRCFSSFRLRLLELFTFE